MAMSCVDRSAASSVPSSRAGPCCISQLHQYSDAFLTQGNDDLEAGPLNLLHLADSAHTLSEFGVKLALSASAPKMHGPWQSTEGTVYEHISEISDGNDGGFWLVRKDSYSMKLNVDFSGGQLPNADSNAHPVMFHGTEWAVA